MEHVGRVHIRMAKMMCVCREENICFQSSQKHCTNKLDVGLVLTSLMMGRKTAGSPKDKKGTNI